MWIGLNLATQLVRPITALINAAEKVRDGDLEVKVEENAYADELSILSRAFNRMTSQLLNQRKRLVETNYEIDKRRSFCSSFSRRKGQAWRNQSTLFQVQGGLHRHSARARTR